MRGWSLISPPECKHPPPHPVLALHTTPRPPGWDQAGVLRAVLRVGLTHRQAGLSCLQLRLGSVFCPEGTLFLLWACPAIREQGEKAGLWTRLHSWGRLRALPGASAGGHTHPEASREWAPSGHATPGGQQHSCSHCGSREAAPLRVPPSGLKWLGGSWAVGRRALSSWPQISCDRR